MITRPFNFAAHLRQPSLRLDPIPFVDAVFLALFFIVLSSRFVVAPGIELDLPTLSGAERDAIATSRVLTVGEVEGREMIIFEGRILTLESLARKLDNRAEEFAQEVLMVRADRDVSVDVLTRCLALVRGAGFLQVVLAAEPEPGDEEIPGR